jgi:aspartyl-tRNA(Asn)/glutamyl-tRNA(Gln) amidotransferase subunit B
LPKGYQISQYDEPIAEGGWFNLKTQNSKLKTKSEMSNLKSADRRVRIRRVHLEEDTGKLIHVTNLKSQNSKLKTKSQKSNLSDAEFKEKVTLVDFNRSGVPLLEMVTEPDLRSAGEAKEFAKWFARTVRYLGVSDCDMEKGSMRLEANISLKKLKTQNSKLKATIQMSKLKDFDLPEYKVEVKNINSFRFLGRAIEYEIERQRKLLEQGKTPAQETRGFDENRGVTFSQRSKEEAADYRYFPEPDIPPLELSEKMVREIGEVIPELPLPAFERLVKAGVREEWAEVLVADREVLLGFDALVKGLPKRIGVEEAAKQVVNQKLDLAKLSTDEVVRKLRAGQKSFSVSGDELKKLVEQVIKEYPGPVAEYKKGKTGVLGYLVGQVAKLSKGQADPREVRRVLERKLKQV